jgi:aldehyde:ferredoxin oxidoreductase
MPNGYMGKILMADLSTGELRDEMLDEETGRKYIGGYGLGARFIYDRQKGGIDPIGPDSIFGITTGMFSGTPMISASRYIVVGKSPLTGSWGDANSGGYFGPNLKFSGYDAVFFTGISEKPVYLYIDNGKAELKDASYLWGKDTFEVDDVIKTEHGKDAEVACIGPSGERIALISSVMNNKGRAAGRSGLGAVMGSKKLKAVVVKGNMKVPIADEVKAKELRKKYLGELTGHVNILRDAGTPSIVTMCAESGDSPTKNWSGTATIDFPEYKNLGAGLVIALQEKKYACYQCPIGCGGHMKAGTGEYKYEAGAHKPEYETLCMFGSNCLNSNLESIIKLNNICNRYGLDTISTGASIAMTIECYERGILSKADTDGIEMTWGNHRSIVAMTEKLAKREGFGNIIADGVKKAGERIGKNALDYAMHIQGQELPAHDPKLGIDWAIGYRMDATPARHTQGPGQGPPGLPMPAFDRRSSEGRGEPYRIGGSFTHVIQSSGLCTFLAGALPNVKAIVDFMKAISGWDLTIEELLTTGERIGTMRHMFNIREGLNPLKYEVPGRAFGHPPPVEGPLTGITVDENTLYHDFLTAMGWDAETTVPSKDKLLELGLDDIAVEYYS